MAKNLVAKVAIPAVLLLIFVSAFAGQLLGQPILLAFVETGSMSPTLEPGDGFIALPMFVAGPVEEGDVITWNAKELHGGGLVTHRVVRETPDGFITQGDANPVTDQDGPEPPVKRSEIKAKALQIGGQLVVIPKIGLVVMAIGGAQQALVSAISSATGSPLAGGSQTLSYVLFAIGIGSYVLFTITEDESSRRDTGRDTSRGSDVVNAGLVSLVLTLLLVALITASMVVPSGTVEYEFVSSDSDAPGPEVIKRGTTESTEYIVPSTGLIPTAVFFETKTEGISIDPKELRVPGGQERNTTVVLQAPEERGGVTRAMVEHRYLAIVPVSTIRALYEIHPWLPIIYIDSIFGIGFEALAFVLIGTGQKRMRSRETSRT